MKIRGQSIIKTDKYVWIKIRSCWWGASKTYHWSLNDPGVGISEEVFNIAKAENLHIRSHIYHKTKGGGFGTYEITWRMMEKLVKFYKSIYIVGDLKPVLVTPLSAWTKIPTLKDKKLLEQEEREKLRVYKSLETAPGQRSLI